MQVLFVGRLERRKGVDLFLDAAVQLVRSNPQVDFILAGKDTDNTEVGKTYREWFADKYRDPALSDRVRFTGAVSEDELYQLYCDCDVFCLPSRYESFGLVLLEAMMFSKPVVGVKIGGMQEIVEVNGNGFLAEPESAASLEQCLRPLIEDAALRTRFGQRSRAIYEAKYSADIMAANTAQYYGDIATGRYPRMRTLKETRPVRIGRMIREFAGIIAEVTALSPENAERMAQFFLSSHKNGFYIDYLESIKNLLARPDGKFVSCLYQLLLNRDETPQELADGVHQLTHQVARGYLIQQVATCDEAKQMGVPTGWWLPHAMAWGGVANAVAPSAAAPPRGLAKLRGRIKRLPLVSKAARYLKRLILLPWEFAKLHHSFHLHQQTMRELFEGQKRELHEALHQQTREWRALMGAQMNELRAEVMRRSTPSDANLPNKKPGERRAA